MTRPASRGSLSQNSTVPAIGQGPRRRFQNVWGTNVICGGQKILRLPAGEGLMRRGRRRRPEKTSRRSGARRGVRRPTTAASEL
jgi:hypothetical protein